MVRLVDDLLDVSRITRGKIELRGERVELAAVLASAVETSRPLIDAAGHELIVDGSARSRCSLDADPMRLAQVFANLLNNAAKYTDRAADDLAVGRSERGADVAVIGARHRHRHRRRDAAARLRHVHAGRPHAAPRAGRARHRARRSCEALVEMHGGTRRGAAATGSGSGSEFIVRLPLAAEVPRASEPRRRRAPVAPPLAPLAVLVVDDNRDAADSLGDAAAIARRRRRGRLRRPGGARVARGDPPGRGAARHRHAAAWTATRSRAGSASSPGIEDVVLIALTGWGQDDDRRRAREAGFDHHLVKPARRRRAADADALAAESRRRGARSSFALARPSRGSPRSAGSDRPAS